MAPQKRGQLQKRRQITAHPRGGFTSDAGCRFLGVVPLKTLWCTLLGCQDFNFLPTNGFFFRIKPLEVKNFWQGSRKQPRTHPKRAEVPPTYENFPPGGRGEADEIGAASGGELALRLVRSGALYGAEGDSESPGSKGVLNGASLPGGGGGGFLQKPLFLFFLARQDLFGGVESNLFRNSFICVYIYIYMYMRIFTAVVYGGASLKHKTGIRGVPPKNKLGNSATVPGTLETSPFYLPSGWKFHNPMKLGVVGSPFLESEPLVGF